MSYKNGAKYIKLRSLYEGNIDEDIIVAAANESVRDITKYHIIVDGRIVETILEDDAAEDEFSIIDALYYLNHRSHHEYEYTKLMVYTKLTQEQLLHKRTL